LSAFPTLITFSVKVSVFELKFNVVAAISIRLVKASPIKLLGVSVTMAGVIGTISLSYSL